MSNNAVYTSINDLKNWFFLGEKPLWVLYGTASSSASDLRNSRYLQNISVRDMEESWVMLEGQINSLSRAGAEFSVKVDSHPKFTSSSWGRLIIQGQGAGMTSNHHIGGIGIPSGYLPASEVDRRIGDAVEVAMMRKENEELKDALEEAQHGQGIAGFISKAIDSGQMPDLIKAAPALLQGLSALLKGQSVSLAGFPEQSKPDETPKPPSQELDEKQLGQLFSEFYITAGDLFEDPDVFLSQLIALMKSNPQKVKELRMLLPTLEDPLTL